MTDQANSVSLKISTRADIDPQLLTSYGSAVSFVGLWIKMNSGVEREDGTVLTGEDILKEFNENVSRIIFGETKGNA